VSLLLYLLQCCCFYFRGDEKLPPGGGESVKSNSTHASAMVITPVLAAVAKNSNGCLQESTWQQ
jgi:hypothetical protein